MSSTKITQLLQDAEDYDKDKRYMAASDLCQELLKDSTKLDVTIEKRICSAFLKQLDDQSIDVQGNAVKCIAKIVPKIQESQVGEVVNKLTECILTGQAESRDIYATCLKGLISEVPESFCPILCNAILGRFVVEGIEKGASGEIREECVDILNDLLKRFGNILYQSTTLAPNKDYLVNVLTDNLVSDRASLKKRVTACIGSLAYILPYKLLNILVTMLVDRLRAAKSKDDIHTYVLTIGSISRTIGYKLGNHLDTIVPLLFPYCKMEENVDNPDADKDHELVEIVLNTFECLIKRCPREITKHVRNILDLSTELISYDPNYTYNDDEEMDDSGEWSGFEDEEVYSDDDDDTSWKVRKGAVKLIDAIIKSRSELLREIYSQISEKLVERFKEREENVKLEIFSAYSSLIRSTLLGDSHTQDETQITAGGPALVRLRSSANVLYDQVPVTIDATVKQLKSKSHKTRAGVTQMLLDLATCLPTQLQDHLSSLLPDLERNMEDSVSTPPLKVSTMHIIKKLLRHATNFYVFQQHTENIVKHATSAVQSDYYKLTAEGLRVLGALCRVLRPDPENAIPDVDFNFKPYLDPIYDSIQSKLKLVDIDQEVKQSAISAISSYLARFGDQIPKSKVTESMGYLIDRLKNEVTRLATLRGFIAISKSPVNADIAGNLAEIMPELCSFLKKQSRSLRLITLEALNGLIKRYRSDINATLLQAALNECPQFFVDSDLHLAQLSLELATTILEGGHKFDVTGLTTHAVTLARSSSLQGKTLEKLQTFFQIVVKFKLNGLTHSTLINELLKNEDSITASAFSSVAICAAKLCISSSETDKFIAQFTKDINSSTLSEAKRRLSVLCLGEIGKECDLSANGDIVRGIDRLFESQTEKTKSAASFAFGNISIGNLDFFLPKLLKKIQAEPSHQYLLLNSMKEIVSHHPEIIIPYLNEILPIMLMNSESPEETIRNIVAECIGKLSIVSPDKLTPILTNNLKSQSALTRATIATSFKFACSNPQSARALEDVLGLFLKSLQDSEIVVVKAALISINAITHHASDLLKKRVPDFMDRVYEETKIKPHLIKEVDLGPFKHKVDEGLPLRKAAFSIFDTMLDNMHEKINDNKLIEHLLVGLDDHIEDIQILCHQILSKLCHFAGGNVLGHLDSIIEPLSKCIDKQVKQLESKQEVEKASDILRSALRAVETLSHIPDNDTNNKFQEFLKTVHSNEHNIKVLEAIQSQRETMQSY
eukprot:CAMPEP_0115033814 /NCGR_PEP_ID=MMETSP0216-20121206/40191_1 /TAXON_ID=223996 /ORGANISM="Protocruzia adherens, Strain Boccale" /LENGTH=1233 /DNA_ID=CAMNT_0002412403 /DNA_START=112 /DNA_END=3813 /DNA_ORIENTATION=-